jgi:hypothetical protein
MNLFISEALYRRSKIHTHQIARIDRLHDEVSKLDSCEERLQRYARLRVLKERLRDHLGRTLEVMIDHDIETGGIER